MMFWRNGFFKSGKTPAVTEGLPIAPEVTEGDGSTKEGQENPIRVPRVYNARTVEQLWGVLDSVPLMYQVYLDDGEGYAPLHSVCINYELGVVYLDRAPGYELQWEQTE